MACGCADRRASLVRAMVAIADGRASDAAVELRTVSRSARANLAKVDEAARAAARAAAVATSRLLSRRPR